MKDFLTFRKMITPMVIQIIFWIGIAACIIMGLSGIIGGAIMRGGAGAVLIGLFTLLIGPLMVRIYCELLIIFFRMNESLDEIKNNTAQK